MARHAWGRPTLRGNALLYSHEDQGLANRVHDGDRDPYDDYYKVSLLL